jgi:UDP-hydrolysing UDP-N-acetyl-D-glucosamine 2-epimerase
MKTKRKICVVTGTRAEYGLLYWLMHEIQNDEQLQLQLVVTGMHLSPEFGLTFQQIEADGFKIDYKVEMLLSSDTRVGVAKSVAVGVMGFADAFQQLAPDIIVILGDRYEILAAAQAALLLNIPIAHLHGGEVTEGAVDESIRHAVTKMAHIHFVASEAYRRRVIQLGEHPDRVFNVGAPGLDNAVRLPLLSKEELEQSLGIRLKQPTFLVTYHPETTRNGSAREQIEQLLTALEAFPEATLILTKANADSEGRLINQMLEYFVQKHSDRAKLFASLGQIRYLSALRYVDVVIGNSSSGIIEVPFFKKPTVNIGNRQKGRLKSKSIIDCKCTATDIINAIETAMNRDFRESLVSTTSLFGDGNASARIKRKLKEIDLQGIIQKSFYDIEFD